MLERGVRPARRSTDRARSGVTTLMGVPANYLFMAQDPAFARADLSSLRRAVVGGAPMPVPLIETWRDRGIEIVQGYGLTEAAPNVLCLPPEDAMRKIGSAGKPYPYVDVDVAGRASCSCAARTSSRATGAILLRRRSRSRTGGCTPATSSSATTRLLLDQGPVEGDVHLRWRERLPGRGRVRPPRASRDQRRRGRRRARRAVGRGRDRVRRLRRRRVRARDRRVLPRAPGTLQGAEGVRFVEQLPRNSMGKIQKSELQVTA